MSKFILSGFADEASPMLDEQLALLQQLGIHYIEPRTVDKKNITAYTPKEAEVIAKRMAEKDVRVSAIGSPIGKILITDDFAPHLDDHKRTIEIAQAMGAPYIRLFSFYIPEGEDPAKYQGKVLSQMEQFVKAAQGSGVTLLHENEKAIYGDVASRCLEIATQFKGELYLTFDPSNFVQCGQETIEAFDMLFPYVRYMHFKDSVATNAKAEMDRGFEVLGNAHRLVGDGDGNFHYIIDKLHKAGYEGFASVEPHIADCELYSGSAPERFVLAAQRARRLIEEITGA